MLKTDTTINQLIEINRALTQDLDIIRRSVSVLGRERDELLVEVEGLRKQADQKNSRDCTAKIKRDLIDIKIRLEEGRSDIDRFREHIEEQMSLLCRYYTDDQKKRQELFDELKQVLSSMMTTFHRLVVSKIEGVQPKERLQ